MVVMARGVGTVIRNDFRSGEDVEAYLKSTIEKISPYFPQYELTYDEDWGIIHFWENDENVPVDLLLASGFWYVIDGFALLNLFHPRSYKFKLQSYGLARALGESEIWYCSDYVLDMVEPEYTFEEFMATALNSGIVEYYEGIQDEYDTSYFHEVLRATQPVLKKFSVLIIGSDEVFKSFAAEHGVELSLPCIDQHRIYYDIELEYEGLDGHPFLQDIYRLHDVFDIWEVVNSQEMNPSDDEL